MPDIFKVDHKIEVEHISSPVTALAFLHTQLTTLLLAGEGPLLRVFDHVAQHSIHAERVLDTQAIHGIQVLKTECDTDAEEFPFIVLVWGGRSVCCIRLDAATSAGSKGRLKLRFQYLIPESLAPDWILDSCFLSKHSTRQDVDATCLDVVLLTAHNVLLSLKIQCPLHRGTSATHVVRKAATGPRSILYSGHVILLSSGQVLIAAGTAFGEVLLWSYSVEEDSSMSQQPMSSLLHHTFTGHEGSVFGVRISEEISIPGSDTVRRILASCSDDRTIRIWDVSDITNESPVGGQEDAATASVETGFATSTSRAGQDPNRYIAVAMGHLSRIWGLRFLAQQGSTQQLLSYGEDASLQVWELDVVNLARPPGTVPEDPFLALRHQDTYRFHSGKHIWSVAVLGTDDGPSKVSTGGADGCIACYDIALNEMQDRRISLWSMKGVWDKCDVQDKWPHANATSTVARSPTESPAKSTFTALKGRWVLQRTIESALSWHPSGAFKGSAVFELRPPTNKAYDMEYLYVEEGNFTTKQGLSFLGSRRYVYRYQASTDKITAWFVNVDDKTSVDYFFHDIYFQKVKVADPQFEGWQAGSSIAKGYHLCVKDDYWAEYEFKYSGAGLRKWNLAYNVKGPEKDYVANAHYTRDDNAVEAIDGVCEGLPPHAMATEGQRPDLDPQDSFKSYAWVSDVEFLTTTEYGHVLLGTLHSANQLPTLRLVDQHTFQRVSWEKLTRLDNLKSYCIAASVSGMGIAFLSGSEGTIYLYRHRERSISPLITLPLKVSGLFVQVLRQITDPFEQVPQLSSTGVVASCLGFATANALILELTPSRTEEPQFAIVRRMTLIIPSSFVVTSACFTDSQKLVILGARSGALAFYDISASSDINIGMTASCCVRHIHGEDAVTVIKSVPLAQSLVDTDAGYILTSGRDGRYAIHHWKLDQTSQDTIVDLETVHASAPSFGPNIEGAVFQASTNDLLLWGFRSKHFVVWNHTKQREVLTIECGGSHRGWAFTPGMANAGSTMSLVWTKASLCCIDSHPRASHEVLQDGGHGREIKAMAISPLQDDGDGSFHRLVATGAEDTTIRIFSYKYSYPDTPAPPFQCLGAFTKHTTGVQQLRWSKNGQFLFSAASCEEFYSWRVQSVPFYGVGVVCDSRCPVKSESADLRIMDFDVVEIGEEKEKTTKKEHLFLITMVYSDSSIRVYCFDSVRLEDKYELLLEGTYGASCLTQALTMYLGNEFYLCTAGTDGHIALWPLTAALEQNGITSKLRRKAAQTPDSLAIPIEWSNRRQVHQNSINCVTKVCLSDDEIILVTAGDDSGLAFTRIASFTNPMNNAPQFSTLLIPNAHAAAITAVQYVCPLGSDSKDPTISRHRFATSGPDQRLKFWLLSVDMERSGAGGLQVVKEANVHTSVPDASCVYTFAGMETEGGRIVVAGIGMEVWVAGKGKEEDGMGG